MYHSIQFNQIFSTPDTILASIIGIIDIIPNTLLISGHDILKIALTGHTSVRLTFIYLPKIWVSSKYISPFTNT